MKRATLVAGAFLILHPIFAYAPFYMWGGDLLRYYPVWVSALFLLLGGGLLVPNTRNRVLAVLCRASDGGSGSRAWVPYVLLVVVGGAVFIGLRSAVHLLGDGYLYLRELEAGRFRTDRAPLAFWTVWHLHRLGGMFWQAPEITSRVYSFASGLLYLALVLPTVRTLGRDRVEGGVLLGFLLTPGFVQFFFGYVETYALLMPVGLAYLLTGVRAVQGRGSIWLPVLLLGVLVPMHLIHALLAPSLALLLWTRRDAEPAWKLAACLVLSPLLVIAILPMAGVPVGVLLKREGGAAFLSLLAEPGFEQPYRLLSPGHWVDLFNQYFLAAPAALLALCLYRREGTDRDAVWKFLSVAALFPVLFTLFANPKIGAFRDWDVLAVPALPFSLWAGVSLIRWVRSNLAEVGLTLCGAAALHTLLWVGVNARGTAAEVRFESALERSDLSAYARSYGWETIGGYYRDQNRIEQAFRAYRKAVEANPENSRHWNAVGNLYRTSGQPAEAVQYFQEALNRNPGSAEVYSNEGNAYHQMGRYGDAVRAYRKAIELDPGLAEAHSNLGIALSTLGQHSDAIKHHRKAIELNPNFTEAYSNLGNVYHDLGNYKTAVRLFQKAIELRPDYAEAYSNLGNAFLGLQEFETAIGHLQKAIALKPGLARAYFNVGTAYLGLGRYRDAIDFFQKTIERDPSLTKAYHSMGAGYFNLKQMDRVRACFEKVLELDPNYSQAAEMRAWLKANP